MKPESLEQKIMHTRNKIDYVQREYNACVDLALYRLSAVYRRWLIELLNMQGELMARRYSRRLQRALAATRIVQPGMALPFLCPEGGSLTGLAHHYN